MSPSQSKSEEGGFGFGCLFALGRPSLSFRILFAVDRDDGEEEEMSGKVVVVDLERAC